MFYLYAERRAPEAANTGFQNRNSALMIHTRQRTTSRRIDVIELREETY